ncbi:MAG: hypothetical protein JW925_11380 [Syntrophaceae bacterium]|nr:hypothetical protein [Syntrophaceae bacterium]
MEESANNTLLHALSMIMQGRPGFRYRCSFNNFIRPPESRSSPRMQTFTGVLICDLRIIPIFCHFDPAFCGGEIISV